MRTLLPGLRICCLLFVVFHLIFPQPAGAYSVLSHEEVVDMAWLPHIVPLLRTRFPNLTDDQIREAHAYAYGGSVIQDIGYYPFGSHEFSDLLHYVRTGDFVSALIRESSNPDEYAFALGALAHYLWGRSRTPRRQLRHRGRISEAAATIRFDRYLRERQDRTRSH